MKFATKHIRQYPHHLRYVTTLPWEIKKSFFADIQQIWKKMQTNIDFFGVYIMESFSVPTANKIFHVTVLYYYCGIRNSSKQMSLQCLLTNNDYNIVFSDENKILIKKFVFKEVHSEEVDRRIS